MAILDFSVSGLCRQHVFGSVTKFCFGISVSNVTCMSFLAVGRTLTIFSYVAFKMAALWFWTMFNCNPPIAPCYPLLWGGGILVDHWSTISSWYLLWYNVNLIYWLVYVKKIIAIINGNTDFWSRVMWFANDFDENHWLTKKIAIHDNQCIISFLVRYFLSWTQISAKTIIDRLLRHCRSGRSFLT